MDKIYNPVLSDLVKRMPTTFPELCKFLRDMIPVPDDMHATHRLIQGSGWSVGIRFTPEQEDKPKFDFTLHPDGQGQCLITVNDGDNSSEAMTVPVINTGMFTMVLNLLERHRKERREFNDELDACSYGG